MDKLIELREVTAGYGNKIALRNVTLDVWKNDFLGIIGPNGGGKTTLLKVILGLLPPISGTIRFYDENVEVPSLKIGYIVGIAVILFGCKAVSQNPFISKKQKILWMLTILFLNWIGLLWYYYTFYMKEK